MLQFHLYLRYNRGKRKRSTKTPQSITTINTDHIAAKRKGQFVRPFIFLVSNKDPKSKYLKRVSMACSHSCFDYLGPDILTDILQYPVYVDQKRWYVEFDIY